MERLGWTGVLVSALTVTLSSCGNGAPPPPSSDTSSTAHRISGNERLGWDQVTADARQLATLRYAAYVDGNRVELADVSCGGLSQGVSACSSRMPAMAAGAHTIVVVSFIVDGNTVVESSRTPPIRVTLSGATEQVP